MSTQPQVRRPSFWEAVIWWRFFVAIFLVSLPFFGLFFVPQLKEKVADYELRSVGLTKGQKFTNDIGMSFVYVKAGTFQMGRSKDETEFVLEDKAREVTLTKGYWISVTEVTQEQYEKIMGSNPSKVLGSNIPVHGVTWKNAVDFCRALSLREGRAYSLPTEAQWEFACKAGERAARYGPIDDIAWYFSNAKNPREVAAKEANGFGLHDMLGNVAEWCWDIDHIGRKRDVDPQGISERHHRRMFPKLSICREIRGGHFASTKRRCRATASTCAPQDFHSHWLGFRLVCYGKSKVVHTKRYDGGKLVGQGPVSFSVNGELFPKMGSCLRFVDRENKVIRFSTFDGKLRDKKEFRKKVVAPQRGRSFINSFDIEFLWVEPGTFTMGDKGKKGPTNGDWQSVWLTKGYWLSRYELTQSTYAKIMGTRPAKHKGPNRPVESVSWYDLQNLCKALSMIEGVTYRLPTEAEWEYAARAGGLGPSQFDRFAWYERNSKRATAQVGGKRANAWGFHDVFGNVSEWCQDGPKVYIPSRRPERDPRGYDTSSHRALRGGSYRDKKELLHVAKRQRKYPSLKSPAIGGRLLLVAQ